MQQVELGRSLTCNEDVHLPLLTVYGPIARAMASGLGARHQPHQGHAADQRDPAQSVCLGLLVLQLSRMLDTARDERMRFCTQQCTRAHLHLNCMTSERDARSRAGADAASAEHSMQTGLELREASSASPSLTGDEMRHQIDNFKYFLPQRVACCADCKRHGHGTAASSR